MNKTIISKIEERTNRWENSFADEVESNAIKEKSALIHDIRKVLSEEDCYKLKDDEFEKISAAMKTIIYAGIFTDEMSLELIDLICLVPKSFPYYDLELVIYCLYKYISPQYRRTMMHKILNSSLIGKTYPDELRELFHNLER